MSKLTKEELQKKYASLPPELKDAIYSVDTADSIKTVAAEFGLHIDQAGILAEEVGLVLMGITGTSEFTEKIMGALEIDRVKANEIASRINEKIFSSIKGVIRKLTENKSENGAVSKITGIPNREGMQSVLENPESIKIDTIFDSLKAKDVEPEIVEEKIKDEPKEEVDILRQKTSQPTSGVSTTKDPYRELPPQEERSLRK